MQALYPEFDMEIAHATDVALGEVVPVSTAEKAKAEKAIRRMRRSLKKWLKLRKRNDQAAIGQAKARIPAHVLAKTLPQSRDWALEQRLAVQLHALLSEVMDASKLPNPDVSKDPNAAVKLAVIAIRGGLPQEAQVPSEVGILPALFIWPVVIIVGLVMMTLMFKISSDADLAAQKEENRCRESGACTDSGFWLKMAGVAVLAWVAWDKLGVKKAFAK